MNNIFIREMCIGGGGLRVAVKDSLDIAGFPTTAGSSALACAGAAARHADVVLALLEADCRIVGKANMHELAYGVTGINEFTGTPVNPLFPELVPGGSSSGSAAAVAAGLADFAIGTDTGGSIRTPAACCGVFGFKPTFGLVSRVGAHPARSSLDCIGPIAATADLMQQAMEIIVPGFRRLDAPQAISLGYVDVDAEPAIKEALQASLVHARVALVPKSLPSFAAAFDANIAIIGAETWAAFGDLLQTGLVGADVAARLEAGRNVTSEELDRAEAVRQLFRAEVDVALADVDALVLPTLPVFPPLLSEAAAAAPLRLTALVRQFNLSGHPAVTIPIISADQRPCGIQLVGRIGSDESLSALARRLSERIHSVEEISA